MSIPVGLEALAGTIEEFGFAYLLTVSDDLRAHAVAVTPQWGVGVLTMAGGRRTTANATARPAVSLVWPPVEPGGYSLIVDGDAAVDGDVVTFRPVKAVLHRPAGPGAEAVEGTCGADCHPVM
jgi:hypothetical protein